MGITAASHARRVASGSKHRGVPTLRRPRSKVKVVGEAATQINKHLFATLVFDIQKRKTRIRRYVETIKI